MVGIAHIAHAVAIEIGLVIGRVRTDIAAVTLPVAVGVVLGAVGDVMAVVASITQQVAPFAEELFREVTEVIVPQAVTAQMGAVLTPSGVVGLVVPPGGEASLLTIGPDKRPLLIKVVEADPRLAHAGFE